MEKFELNAKLQMLITAIQKHWEVGSEKVIGMENENFKLLKLLEYVNFIELRTFEMRLLINDYKLQLEKALQAERDEQFELEQRLHAVKNYDVVREYSQLKGPISSKNWDQLPPKGEGPEEDYNEPPF